MARLNAVEMTSLGMRIEKPLRNGKKHKKYSKPVYSIKYGMLWSYVECAKWLRNVIMTHKQSRKKPSHATCRS